MLLWKRIRSLQKLIRRPAVTPALAKRSFSEAAAQEASSNQQALIGQPHRNLIHFLTEIVQAKTIALLLAG
jgi:hypothetical protein